MPRISRAVRAAVCSLSFMELPSPVATSHPSTDTLEVKLGLCAGPCLEITLYVGLSPSACRVSCRSVFQSRSSSVSTSEGNYW